MLLLLPLWLAPVLPQGSRAPTVEDAAPGRVERRLTAMGTWLELRIRGADRSSALAASERAVHAIEATEARLSTWNDTSELARLNRSTPGEWQVLSPELAADLARAGHFWRETAGAFDPGLGALVAAWGLRTGGRSPSPAEIESARALGGFAAFELDGLRARRLDALAAIEEGGFGKGVGLDAALAELASAGVEEAVLDLGGQIALLGTASTTLADPRDRARAVLELELRPGSLSTSGNSERGIVVDGVPRGHILDPRKGEPAPDFGSVSVWAPDATAADCLSTGLYVMGTDGALRWCAAHPGIELVLLIPAGERLRAVATAGWRGHARALVPELDLCFVGTDASSDPLSSTPTAR